jgi:hypothetical protein
VVFSVLLKLFGIGIDVFGGGFEVVGQAGRIEASPPILDPNMDSRVPSREMEPYRVVHSLFPMRPQAVADKLEYGEGYLLRLEGKIDTFELDGAQQMEDLTEIGVPFDDEAYFSVPFITENKMWCHPSLHLRCELRFVEFFRYPRRSSSRIDENPGHLGLDRNRVTLVDGLPKGTARLFLDDRLGHDGQGIPRFRGILILYSNRFYEDTEAHFAHTGIIETDILQEFYPCVFEVIEIYRIVDMTVPVTFVGSYS